MERRESVASCGPSAATPETKRVAGDAQPRRYSGARRVEANGAPLVGKAIPANRNLIFHYPYAATPCFLLNLGRPAAPSVELKTADEKRYECHGAVGPARSIVAYSAI